MAVIKNIDYFKPFIPNIEDLMKCGNYATKDESTLRGRHLFAFVFDPCNRIFIKQFKVSFMLVSTAMYHALVLTNEEKKCGRYCDFMVIKRDVRKPISDIKNWKWNVDEIGVFIQSDNYNGNIIYFGTDENDSVVIRCGIYEGFSENSQYEPIERDLKNMIIEALKAGAAVTGEKEDKPTLCLPAPEDVKSTPYDDEDSGIDYRAVLQRYARMKFRDRTAITTVTTEVVYAD